MLVRSVTTSNQKPVTSNQKQETRNLRQRRIRLRRKKPALRRCSGLALSKVEVPVTRNQRPEVWIGVALIFAFLFVPLFISIKGEAEDMEKIDLPKPHLKSAFSIEEAINKRRSVRSYSSKDLTMEQIGQLLWSCQGITSPRGFRAAPSAGALHPLEIYLLTKDGLYKYVPQDHCLVKKSDKDLKSDLATASWGQQYIKEAPIDIVICAVYERVTSRYGKRGIRYTDIEVGHAAENIHLQAVALGLSSVPIGAFDDGTVSRVLGLSRKEKPLYIIPVGYER